MHLGQAEVAAAVVVGEAGVVEPEEVEDGGVQVVDVHLVLLGFDAVLVGGSVPHAPLHSTARHPHGEARGSSLAEALWH